MQCTTLLILIFVYSLAQANDTAVSVSAGGLQIVKSEKIELRSEKLFLSANKVKVEYEFLNTDSSDLTLDVAFPLPEIRSDIMRTFEVDEMYLIYSYLSGNGSTSFVGNLRSYLNRSGIGDFELRVNGIRRDYHYRYSAVDFAGNDITGRLVKDHVPLSVSFLKGWEEEGELARNPSLNQRLRKMGLLTEKGAPAWINQLTYFWSDVFPAKKKHRVQHEYTPLTGAQWVSSKEVVKSLDDIEIADGDWKWKDYCPSAEFQKKLIAALSSRKNRVGKFSDDEPYPRARELRYILTTANNWSGPIGQFELEVEPMSTDSLVAFCWPDPVIQDRQGKVRLRKSEFEPKQDLRILFLERS